MVLWIDQLAIILDDFATCYTPPRILNIGDEMKYEKLQLKWLGADVVVTTERSKAKISADVVEVRVSNKIVEISENFYRFSLSKIFGLIIVH